VLLELELELELEPERLVESLKRELELKKLR